MQMHVNTPSQCAPARRSSVLMRYWEPHWSYAVRVDCAHLQAENDALHDRLQQCHDHAAKAQPHKCWLSCARSTATLSSQALREDEGVAATSRAAPILSVDFGKSDPPSPLIVVRESSYSREMVVDKWLIRTQRLRRSAEMAMHEAWARKGLVPDRSCPFGSTDTKRARETH